ncbi:MAG: ectonucleotide pyrophosphatase/phosphodiesterase [Defluviitaleaceae bacterium]|nr:ectonucleotide pyrophosphatase/phosphodiesterase [Defluviitaleaceae bacterium]
MKLVVISFDGVSDKTFEGMAADSAHFPNIAKFMKECDYTGGVSTTFVSNTYPIHTSIITGKLPHEHGIISNILHEDEGQEVWAQHVDMIKTQTLWDAAREKGLKIGAVAWPVTCGAPIKWNLPEVHILKGQNRMREHLRHGSPIFQMKAFLRHGKKLDGLKQPNLDDFLTCVAADLIKTKNPDALFLHFLVYDGFSHDFGTKSAEIETAKKALDANFGRILEGCGDAAVVIFADHGHKDVGEAVDLNEVFGAGEFEMCAGVAFAKSAKKADFEGYPWFGRFLTDEEMFESGYQQKSAFGIAAKLGYFFGKKPNAANHGYPKDYPDYKVFYAAKNIKKPLGKLPFNDIRNVGAIAAAELGLQL